MGAVFFDAMTWEYTHLIGKKVSANIEALVLMK